MPAHVLVVDDDPALRRMVRRLLTTAAYEVSEASTAEAALAQVASAPPDLVLLDLMMPGMGGLAFIGEFRSISEAPIIMLSVLGAEATKVAALDQGADDYLTKPFGGCELLARVARHLARWTRLRVRADLTNGGVIRTADGYLVVDLSTRLVVAGGRKVPLTAREYDLLAYLARHIDRVLTARHLLHAVWGVDTALPFGAVRVAIYRLRQKLEPQPELPRYLINEPGIGYRLSSTPD